MSVSCFWPQHIVSRDSGGLFCSCNSSIGCREGRGVLLLNFTRRGPKTAVSLLLQYSKLKQKPVNEKESSTYFEYLMILHLNSLSSVSFA